MYIFNCIFQVVQSLPNPHLVTMIPTVPCSGILSCTFSILFTYCNTRMASKLNFYGPQILRTKYRLFWVNEEICDLFTEACSAEVNKHISPRCLKITYLFFTLGGRVNESDCLRYVVFLIFCAAKTLQVNIRGWGLLNGNWLEGNIEYIPR
jgi:hypothetical protein